MAINYVVKEIERLSQEEGLNDQEISEVLGCSRATINRVRNEHGIPRANLANKKDKMYRCGKCGKEVYIRRKERRRLLCPECESIK
jgi:hypothetical protein